VRARVLMVQFLIGLVARIVEKFVKEGSFCTCSQSCKIVVAPPHALSIGELDHPQTVAKWCQRGMALPVKGLVGAYIFVCRLKTLNGFIP
jgi:hypothetical protein